MDFVSCMQKQRLLDSGEYIIISVDDEIYKPQSEDFSTKGKWHRFT